MLELDSQCCDVNANYDILLLCTVRLATRAHSVRCGVGSGLAADDDVVDRDVHQLRGEGSGQQQRA